MVPLPLQIIRGLTMGWYKKAADMAIGEEVPMDAPIANAAPITDVSTNEIPMQTPPTADEPISEMSAKALLELAIRYSGDPRKGIGIVYDEARKSGISSVCSLVNQMNTRDKSEQEKLNEVIAHLRVISSDSNW
jgi:hypothetical protein